MKQSNNFIFLIIFAISLLTVSTTAAQVITNISYLSFRYDGPPVANLTISNTNEERALTVVTEGWKITKPGAKDEGLVKTEEILTSPKRFSIPPKGSRVVRVILTKKSELEENYYRVNFVPDATENSDKKVKGKVNLTVLTGSGVLIFAEPKEPKAELTWNTTGEDLTFKNTGNLNIFVSNFQLCKTDKAAECNINDSIDRLYPNDSIRIAKGAGKRITFNRVIKLEDDSSEVDAITNESGVIKFDNE